jgi:hypothetical protein
MLRTLTLALLAVVASSCPGAEVVINEVFYDPEGSDTGLEFVEIMNCGHATVPLSGWTLETGNGAHPDDWTVEWIGGPLDELPPGGLLLVGESDVVPRPDVVTALDLQNGPDGCRLTDGHRVVDVVGWGEPLFAEYLEGSPAEDVSGGLSLARTPDCVDGDDNGDDFAGRPPTPGARNSLESDVSVEILHAARVVFPTGEPLTVRSLLRNAGSREVPAGAAEVSLLAGGGAAAVAWNDCTLAPRDSCEVPLVWDSPSSGYHRVNVAALFDGDDAPANNVAATSLAVGAPAGLLVLNEIMHSPGEGATEWLEFISTLDDTLSLKGWSVGDDEDAHAVVGASEAWDCVRVPPRGFLVVAKSPPDIDAGGVQVVGTDGWEALSRDDIVVLLDEFETPVERVRYEADWGGERDISLERVRPDVPGDEPSSWGSCVAAEGSTPGRPNSILVGTPPAEGTLAVRPNPFSPDGDGRDDRAVVSFELPTATALARLSVYDVRGRLRGTLLDHRQVASRHELVWDGSLAGAPLPPGLYILALEAIDARAGVLTRAEAAVGIAR